MAPAKLLVSPDPFLSTVSIYQVALEIRHRRDITAAKKAVG
jgi:hypothetical protein